MHKPTLFKCLKAPPVMAIVGLISAGISLASMFMASGTSNSTKATTDYKYKATFETENKSEDAKSVTKKNVFKKLLDISMIRKSASKQLNDINITLDGVSASNLNVNTFQNYEVESSFQVTTQNMISLIADLADEYKTHLIKDLAQYEEMKENIKLQHDSKSEIISFNQISNEVERNNLTSKISEIKAALLAIKKSDISTHLETQNLDKICKLMNDEINQIKTLNIKIKNSTKFDLNVSMDQCISIFERFNLYSTMTSAVQDYFNTSYGNMMEVKIDHKNKNDSEQVVQNKTDQSTISTAITSISKIFEPIMFGAVLIACVFLFILFKNKMN